MTDLPLTALQKVMNAAYEEYGEEIILSQIASFGGVTLSQGSGVVAGWISQNLSETALRSVVGKTAKKAGWFKNITMGTRLGEIVATALPEMSEKPSGDVLGKVMKWVYG